MRIRSLHVVLLVCLVQGTGACQTLLSTAQSSGSISTGSQTSTRGSLSIDFAQAMLKMSYQSKAEFKGANKTYWLPRWGFSGNIGPASGANTNATMWNLNSQGVSGQFNTSFTYVRIPQAFVGNSLNTVTVASFLGSANPDTGLHQTITRLEADRTLRPQAISDAKFALQGVQNIVGSLQEVAPSAVSRVNALCLQLQSQIDNYVPAPSASGGNSNDPLDTWNDLYQVVNSLIPLAPVPELTAGLNAWQSVTISAGYVRNQYTLLNAASTGTESEGFDGWNLKALYDTNFGGRDLGGIMVFGISGGVQRTNNASELSTVNLQTISSSGMLSGMSVDVVKSTSALKGTYTTSVEPTFDADLVWKPRFIDENNTVGIDFFLRSNYDNKTLFEPGVALFLSPKGQPLAVRYGAAIVRNGQNKGELSLFAGATF